MPVAEPVAPARPRARVLLLAVASAAVCGALLAGCAPSGPSPTEETAAPSGASGDVDLIAAIRPSFPDADQVVAVAVVDGDGVRTAYLNADAGTVFEVGSISKTTVGLLLAEAIERGEVELDDPIGDYLDLGDSPAASVTFDELSKHSSGLPTFPSDPAWRARIEPAFLAGEDVLDETVDELVAEAAAEPLAPDAPPQYSNLGASLAGQALAAAAGTDFRSLLVERVFEPAGMETAWLTVEDDEVPAGLAPGFLADGGAAEPSTLGAYAPAGGITATLDDMVAYARAVLDGPFADSAAIVRRQGALDTEIGYFWGAEADHDGHELVEHGGVTAGFGATLRIDRTAGTAVIVLSNRGDSIDDVGESILLRFAS
ncbi:serine hydrolase domain-containing protein [Agromyces sp. MMS24-JH15]|uniref:serine hydrolase domain-containing protein n=1 Tax=Agromyces sp. MMS24-JH15 TaxID=3243765 RepID=UPI003748CBD8